MSGKDIESLKRLIKENPEIVDYNIIGIIANLLEDGVFHELLEKLDGPETVASVVGPNPRGPKGGIKHQPGREHNRKRLPQQKKRLKKKGTRKA